MGPGPRTFIRSQLCRLAAWDSLGLFRFVPPICVTNFGSTDPSSHIGKCCCSPLNKGESFSLPGHASLPIQPNLGLRCHCIHFSQYIHVLNPVPFYDWTYCMHFRCDCTSFLMHKVGCFFHQNKPNACSQGVIVKSLMQTILVPDVFPCHRAARFMIYFIWGENYHTFSTYLTPTELPSMSIVLAWVVEDGL